MAIITNIHGDKPNQASDTTLITEARQSDDALCRELARRLEREILERANICIRLSEVLADLTDRGKSFIEKEIERFEIRMKGKRKP